MNLQTNECFEYMYDELLIASGASPVIPSWFGHSLSGIHTVKTIPQMNVLMKELQHVQHVTVIGGGYIGLEIAETLKLAGKTVRLIQRGQQLMKMLEKGTRKLLGMQMIGTQGVDKRIDVFATALYAGLMLEEYVGLDLAYSPPFNGV